MKRLFKLFLTYNLKTSKYSQKIGGFTLIELLIGLVLAFLIITPLLGFVVNMMNTDRQEQAKATSEQEIQAALDYIVRDLDQAFFIYDGWGLNRTQIKTQLPTVAQGEPVLVFWKRQFLSKAIPAKGKQGTNCNGGNNFRDCDDAFIYSLVAYYLIQNDNANCGTSPWSCTARIARMQLKDALYDENNPPRTRIEEGSPGFSFELEKLTGSSLEQKMNNWTSTGLGNPPMETLIDYIDDSTGANVPPASCPDTPRQSPRPDGLGDRAKYDYRTVPQKPPTFSSFYACVDTDKTIAQVFIRGNALARIRPKGNPPTYVESQSAYFPRATIQAQGRGLLNQNQTSP